MLTSPVRGCYDLAPRVSGRPQAPEIAMMSDDPALMSKNTMNNRRLRESSVKRWPLVSIAVVVLHHGESTGNPPVKHLTIPLCLLMLVFGYLPSFAWGADALAKRSYGVAFSTYLGGSEGDLIRGVACERVGNVIVAGLTMSSDFPVSAEAHQREYGGNGDAFVTKLSPEGRMIWSTYFGGPSSDNAYAVEVDDRGCV